jgi:hypothetical protein
MDNLNIDDQGGFSSKMHEEKNARPGQRMKRIKTILKNDK